MCLFADGFNIWHGSLAGLASDYKGTPAFGILPFPAGQITADNYSESIAFLAWANDFSQSSIELKRVDCVKNNSVVVDLIYKGKQVARDQNGYITYAVDFPASPTTKVFNFNAKGKIVQQFVLLDSSASKKARSDLGELLKKAKEDPTNYPPMAPDENTKVLRSELTQEFKNDLNSEKCDSKSSLSCPTVKIINCMPPYTTELSLKICHNQDAYTKQCGIKFTN